ncbi:aspartate aminotransferase family protein [Bailinhaonella thermotolerans]|uniref:Aspartate aminotransferase family protein n=1 Tax=Bailinhaonella thermotolerans TaxID=1070861 RepID=A0A3A4AFD3_9ACTN|nr:aminotransferase class III-fold pyridoxal phosphate-dependent enzyme [Bailinhaonella thermotolerans]RJL27231.1 aspartate aminotransferase family protein [Bailinhaonella thermotolerans]
MAREARNAEAGDAQARTAKATDADGWDAATHPLWHGSAHMSYVLGAAGPREMLVRGEGCRVFDRAGRAYLDARSGIANVILGYSRRDIAEAMHRQALELPFVCTMRYERPAPVIVEYAAALAAAAPPPLTRVRFTHTGSSAVESALLMARRFQANSGRPMGVEIIALHGAYHGSTLMTMAAGGWPMLHEQFGPMPPGFHHVPPGDAAALEAKIGELGPERVAALVAEPVHGFSGHPLPAAYLRRARELCDRHGILLIYDEVFTGLGRMGPMFAAELAGVVPDVMCLSKTLTAGYAALGAVLATDRVYAAFDRPGAYFAHSSSTDAHPIACAAGLATLRALDGEGARERGTRMGERLAAELARELKDLPLVRGVRALGAYVAIDLDDPPDLMANLNRKRHLQAECERRGVLIDYTPAILMLVPPYTLPDDDADEIVAVVAAVLRGFRDGDVDPARLRPPSASGRR